MSTLNIIYYTGTGNTEEMAKYIGEGAENAGAAVKLINVEEANESAIDADFIAFGSPAVGAEEIAPEMVEFFEGIKDKIIGKTVGLFGSYDWGQGGWMETWREEITNEGLSVVNDGLIIHLAVDDDEKIEKCKEYGRAIVG
ncbi:flavodoxin [Leptotrichia wadei]|uniref:Flavodoxin n=1 Tax=Leptotrichia wadei TaxID=157687 RepID=A0A510KB94_9FUSO|nr:flavodoxin [Leptotrichia wadei]BBM48939.1 flavodoxin/nitric oxide synthase [Leptotrichia wadei]